MEAIRKYSLDGIKDSYSIFMQENAEILCLKVQYDVPCIWAKVNTDAPKAERKFKLYGTGHQHEVISGKYIGSFMLYVSSLVFHLFEEK